MVLYFVQFDANVVYHELAHAFLLGSEVCRLALVTRQGGPLDRGVWQEERPVKHVRLEVDYCYNKRPSGPST